MNYQDSRKLVEFTDINSKFVGFLQRLGYSNDRPSSFFSENVTRILPLDKRRKWFGNTEKPQNRAKTPSLTDWNTWLQERAIVHERLLSSMKTSKYDPGQSNGVSEKIDPKERNSNSKTVVGDKRSNYQCPLQDGILRN